MMERKNTWGRGRWAVMAAALAVAGTLAAPQSAWAGEKKGKDGKVPIVVGTPIVTSDPPHKKK